MIHEDCDWAVAGECEYCGHRTNPDNMITCYGRSFCDEEGLEAWKKENGKA